MIGALLIIIGLVWILFVLWRLVQVLEDGIPLFVYVELMPIVVALVAIGVGVVALGAWLR